MQVVAQRLGKAAWFALFCAVCTGIVSGATGYVVGLRAEQRQSEANAQGVLLYDLQQKAQTLALLRSGKGSKADNLLIIGIEGDLLYFQSMQTYGTFAIDQKHWCTAYSMVDSAIGKSAATPHTSGDEVVTQILATLKRGC